MKLVYKNIVMSLLYYVLNMVSNLYITKLLINKLGLELYGFYPVGNNISNYLVVISIAINSMASRFISVYIMKKKYKEANQYYTSLFFANVIIVGIMIIPVLLLIEISDHIFQIPEANVRDVKMMFFFILASVMINMITTVFAVATVAKDRMDIQYAGRISQVILKIVLFVSIYYCLSSSIVYVGIILFILEIYYLVLQLLIKSKIMPELYVKKKDFNFEIIKEVIGSSIWNSINQLGNSLLFGIDVIIANILLGPEISGFVSLLHIIPSTINSVITAIAGIFIPKYIKAFSENNHCVLEKTVNIAQTIIGIVVSTLVCLFLVFGKYFYKLYLPNYDFEMLAKMSCIYIVPLIFAGAFWSVSNLNIVWNSVKIPAILTIVNGIINLIVMVILLKCTDMGIISIPLTTGVITIIWYFLFIPIYVSKKVKIKCWSFYKIPLIIILMIVPLEILLYCFISSKIVMKTWISFFLYGGICGILGILIGVTLMKLMKILEKKIYEYNAKK